MLLFSCKFSWTYFWKTRFFKGNGTLGKISHLLLTSAAEVHSPAPDVCVVNVKKQSFYSKEYSQANYRVAHSSWAIVNVKANSKSHRNTRWPWHALLQCLRSEERPAGQEQQHCAWRWWDFTQMWGRLVLCAFCILVGREHRLQSVSSCTTMINTDVILKSRWDSWNAISWTRVFICSPRPLKARYLYFNCPSSAADAQPHCPSCPSTGIPLHLAAGEPAWALAVISCRILWQLLMSSYAWVIFYLLIPTFPTCCVSS